MTHPFAPFVIVGTLAAVLAVAMRAEEIRADEQASGRASVDKLLLQDLDRELIDKRPTPPAAPPRNNGDSTASATDGEDLAGESPGNDVLETIERQMRTVEQRMQQQDVSIETQRLQQQIISQIDALLREMGSDPGQLSPSSSRNQSLSPDERPGANSAAADESTDRLAGQSATPVDGRSTETWLKKAWGHLPARLRTPMLNSSVEEFLPSYQALIEDYYRRLAEHESGNR
jgi:hypothetical protein